MTQAPLLPSSSSSEPARSHGWFLCSATHAHYFDTLGAPPLCGALEEPQRAFVARAPDLGQVELCEPCKGHLNPRATTRPNGGKR